MSVTINFRNIAMMLKGRRFVTAIHLLLFILLIIPNSASVQPAASDSLRSEEEYYRLLARVDSTQFKKMFEYPFLALLGERDTKFYKSF